MPDITIKPKGGHRIEVIGEQIFLTDRSGDRVEVDRSRNVAWKSEDPLLGSNFHIPLMGGCVTAAEPEEAFLVSIFMKQPIIAGARRFEVKQVWGIDQWKQ